MPQLPIPAWLVPGEPVAIVTSGGWRPSVNERWVLQRTTATQAIVVAMHGTRVVERRFNLRTLAEVGAGRTLGYATLADPADPEVAEIQREDRERAAGQALEAAVERLRSHRTPKRLEAVHEAYAAWAEMFPRADA